MVEQKPILACVTLRVHENQEFSMSPGTMRPMSSSLSSESMRSAFTPTSLRVRFLLLRTNMGLLVLTNQSDLARVRNDSGTSEGSPHALRTTISP